MNAPTTARRIFLKNLFKSIGVAVFSLKLAPGITAKEQLSQDKQMSDLRPSPPGADPTREQIIINLKRANEVAKKTMEKGSHPFGAILVGADHETVLMEQGNIDTVNHAESTLARLAAEKYTPEELWAMTLYTTAEPCAMCAGTQYWANIGRLVFGMSERQLLDLTGNHAENPTMDIPSRYIFDNSQKNIYVVGPVAEMLDEIAELHRDFWK